MIDILNSINYTLAHPTCWEKASVIFSCISLILTAVVLYYNHKSIKAANKSIKQSIDLHLYEKRLELFKHIKNPDSFYEIPIEIKIIYSDKIYDLCMEISNLCYKRLDELKQLSVFNPNWQISSYYYNIFEQAVKDVDAMLGFYKSSLSYDEEKFKSMKAIREEVNVYTQEIKKKYNILEKQMEKFLIESMRSED